VPGLVTSSRANLVRAKKYEFDEAEVNSVVDDAKKVLGIPRAVLLKDLIRWLFWPTILMAMMIVVVIKLKR
jgi:hypothetical protein